jgi:heme/copper-type cytochrome/quinol oxidase subunit 3
MAVLVATEATLFATLVGSYFYLRFQAVRWPPPGVSEPKPTLPLVLCGVLVATSILLAACWRAARDGRLGFARAALALALLVQAGYLAVQLHLFLGDLGKHPPSDSSYSSIFFTLLGVHHAHVAVGMLLEAFLLLRLAGGLTVYRLNGLRATAFYWHFVNVMAVVVVLTELSPRL